MRACRHRAVRYFWIGFAWGRLEMGETAKHKADAAICQHCGHWLPLGLARDDERTAVEVRAAEIAVGWTEDRGTGDVHYDEDIGWLYFNGSMVPCGDRQWSGWLAHAIHAHHDEQSKEGM